MAWSVLELCLLGHLARAAAVPDKRLETRSQRTAVAPIAGSGVHLPCSADRLDAVSHRLDRRVCVALESDFKARRWAAVAAAATADRVEPAGRRARGVALPAAGDAVAATGPLVHPVG